MDCWRERDFESVSSHVLKGRKARRVDCLRSYGNCTRVPAKVLDVDLGRWKLAILSGVLVGLVWWCWKRETLVGGVLDFGIDR